MAEGERGTAGDAALHRPAVGTAPVRRVGLKDVAARAGVSINTVSRAIRAPATVRPELRRQIEALLDELDYVPNRLAGGLAGAQTGMVGVIVTSLRYSEFAAMIDALQDDLGRAGLSVMLANTNYQPEEELRLVRAMLSWRPAALALIGVDHHPRAVELLRAAGVPVVELWEAGPTPIDSAVGMDHRAVGRSQAVHLLARGYRRLGFIGGVRPHDYRAQRRSAGFVEAAITAGLEPVLVTAPQGGTADLGERLMADLLARMPAVDGVVCNSDVIAMGALRGLARAGRRVPDEIGVIGFGDNEAAGCLTPTLSTVRPPRTAIGRAAAEIVLQRIDGRAAVRRVFEAELVARDSTARPCA
jgi:LacI family gluconate utilization system Gnt-I transcriptional repressor